MNRSGIRPLAVIAAGFLVCAVAPAATFRWVDDQGNVHYSDQVPPEHAKHERATLNAQGRQSALIEGAKSLSQIEQEKRVRFLRAEQHRILAEQRDHDLSLLRTYGSMVEMHLALENKLSTVDAVIRVTESNQQRQQALLDEQWQRAAEVELKGQRVPEQLRNSISAAKRQIASYQAQIRKLEEDKKVINEAFDKDLARLRELGAAGEDPLQFALSNEPKAQPRELPIVSAVICQPGPICQKAWELAKGYVQSASDKPLATETDKVLQSANPVSDREFSLIVTRSTGKDEDTLFLDARCRPSSLGDELCAGTKVRAIRSGFAGYIQTGLGASP